MFWALGELNDWEGREVTTRVFKVFFDARASRDPCLTPWSSSPSRGTKILIKKFKTKYIEKSAAPRGVHKNMKTLEYGVQGGDPPASIKTSGLALGRLQK